MMGLSIGHFELPNVPGAKVEILGQILGIKTEEIRTTAFIKSFRGHQFKVINPFLLNVGISHVGVIIHYRSLPSVARHHA